MAAFAKSAELRENLLCSWAVMLRFYGFEVVTEAGAVTVRRNAAFETRRHVWLTSANHNFLRITCILRSMKLLSCGEQAKAFLACLQVVYREFPLVISEQTNRYWRSAVQ